VAQLASALAWGARGRLFESDHPDKRNQGRLLCPDLSCYIMFYTYILYSKPINRFYTGYTMDIDRSLAEHNRGKTSFMAKGLPWELVYVEEFTSRAEAMKLESFIKKRGAKRYLSDLNSQ